MTFLHGYIDHGTGSILIQALVGGVLGVGYVGRKFIARCVDTVKNRLTGGHTNSTEEHPHE